MSWQAIPTLLDHNVETISKVLKVLRSAEGGDRSPLKIVSLFYSLGQFQDREIVMLEPIDKMVDLLMLEDESAMRCALEHTRRRELTCSQP